MIRVLVVDDSPFMRIALRRLIERDGDMRVVGEAGDGATALIEAARLNPDVVTMDVEMPGMDGLEATAQLAGQRNKPAVIIVSKHTAAGSASALGALAKGAVDTVWKDISLGGVDFGRLERPLLDKLRYWSAERQRTARPTTRAARKSLIEPYDLVAIGASTGGPDAIAALLAASGPLKVPTIIAQHMPAELGSDFASHLSRRIGRPVIVGEPRLVMEPGMTVVLPGGMDGHVVRTPLGLALRLWQGEGVVHPSVDLLLQSAAIASRNAIGIVLTGMGQDGAAGAAMLAQQGMTVMVQDPASCVVGGMPKSALATGHAFITGDPTVLGQRLSNLLARPTARP